MSWWKDIMTVKWQSFQRVPDFHLQSAGHKSMPLLYLTSSPEGWYCDTLYQGPTGHLFSLSHFRTRGCDEQIRLWLSGLWDRGQALRKSPVTSYTYSLIANDSKLWMCLCGRLMVNNIFYQYPTATSNQVWCLLSLMEFPVCSRICKVLPNCTSLKRKSENSVKNWRSISFLTMKIIWDVKCHYFDVLANFLESVNQR